jgi:hypothetical protein
MLAWGNDVVVLCWKCEDDGVRIDCTWREPPEDAEPMPIV